MINRSLPLRPPLVILGLLAVTFLTTPLSALDDDEDEDKLSDTATKALFTGKGMPRDPTPEELKMLRDARNTPGADAHTFPVLEVAPAMSWKEDTTGEDINTPTVWNALVAKAEQGDVDSLYTVGLCYARGHPIPQNLDKAFQRFYLAAQKGHAESAFLAARCLDLKVVKLSPELAGKMESVVLHFYETAKKANHPLAIYHLGGFIDSDKKSSGGNFAHLKEAAVKGYARAQYELALRIRAGEEFTLGYNSVRHLLKTSAEQGYPKAQFELGRSMAQGLPGIEKNQVEAYAWLSTAISNGILDEAKTLIILKNQMSQADMETANKKAAEYLAKFKAPAPYKNPLL